MIPSVRLSKSASAMASVLEEGRRGPGDVLTGKTDLPVALIVGQPSEFVDRGDNHLADEDIPPRAVLPSWQARVSSGTRPSGYSGIS